MFVDKVVSDEVSISHGTSAYTANDVIGGLLTFNLNSPSGCGILDWLKITDEDNEGAALDVYIFNEAPTSIDDDAAFTPTIADLDKLATKVEIAAADYKTVNSLKFAFKDEASEGMKRGYKLDDKGNLYMYVVPTGTPTYASGKAIKMTLSCFTS